MKVVKKITLAGDTLVGKTSLIRKFVFDQYDDKYIITIGTKVTKKELKLKNPVSNDDVELTLMIWDIMGLFGYRPELHKANFTGAKGALLVCDLTRKYTLQRMDDWAKSITDVTGKIPMVALINKADLKDKADFTEDEVKEAIGKYNIPYYFTSAKTGDNVEAAFLQICDFMLRADR
jgi:small GTP-binding protein